MSVAWNLVVSFRARLTLPGVTATVLIGCGVCRDGNAGGGRRRPGAGGDLELIGARLRGRRVRDMVRAAKIPPLAIVPPVADHCSTAAAPVLSTPREVRTMTVRSAACNWHE